MSLAPPSQNSKVKIVLYDDNYDYRNSLSTILNETPGLQVERHFADCRMVYEEMVAHQPDIVLMDIDMPYVNGLQGLLVIKKHFPKIRILMLTVFDDSEKVFEAICFGADGYLLKNISPKKITDHLLDVMEGGSPISPSIARKVLSVFQKVGLKSYKSYHLSEKETEVLRLLVDGNSYKMIAKIQFVSINTISTQIRSIYEKLHVHSASEAVAKAIREQIV